MKFKDHYFRITHFEFWPWWALFIPVLPVYIYGFIRTGKLLYFTTVNPGIPMGGFFGEKKDEILDSIPSAFIANSISVTNRSISDIPSELQLPDNKFPLIAKPNVGERGFQVKLIKNREELDEYHKLGFDYIVQDYIDLPLEFGVLYSKIPGEKSGNVTSLVLKEFMQVSGDGMSSVRQLLMQIPRYRLYIPILEKEYPDRLDKIPAKGTVEVVHRIGNHCRGTRFINMNDCINAQLNETFTNIADRIVDFDYGRFDLKAKSLEDLYAGKGIQIFELNGISSEPGHIYSLPGVWNAYRSLYYHWYLVYRIAKENIKKGVKPTPLNKFILQIYLHFFA